MIGESESESPQIGNETIQSNGKGSHDSLEESLAGEAFPDLETPVAEAFSNLSEKVFTLKKNGTKPAENPNDKQYWELRRHWTESTITDPELNAGGSGSLFTRSRTVRKRRPVDKHEFDYVIFPDNKWALKWDVFVMILIIFTIFQVPFQIGVTAGALLYQDGQVWLIMAFINWCFVADTILYFFRVTHDEQGKMVISGPQIRRAYLKGWFVIDALSCFPSDLILRIADNDHLGAFAAVQILNILRIFRVFRLNRIIHNTHGILLWRLRFSEWKIAGIKLIIYALVFNHWVACLFCWMAYLQAGSFDEDDLYNPQNPNWLQSYHLYYEALLYPSNNNTYGFAGNDFDNIMGRYILAFYWSVMTSTSIGYGDVTASTFPEFWVVSLVMLASGCFWAFFIARAIATVDKASEAQQAYWSRLNTANSLSRSFNAHDSFVSTKMAHREGKTFGHIVEKELVLHLYRQHNMGLCSKPFASIEEISPIMQHLPRYLADRVCLALIQKDLYKLNWLRHPSIMLDTLAGIASMCEVHQYDAKQRLFFTKETVKRGVYIMRRGILTYKESTNKRVSRVYCSNGVIFKEFVVLKSSAESIPSVILSILTWTEMIFIPRKAFKVLFRLHPEVWKDHGRWWLLYGFLKGWSHQRNSFIEQTKIYYHSSGDDTD